MEHILSVLMPLNDLQHVRKRKASERASNRCLVVYSIFPLFLSLSASLLCFASVSPKQNHKYLIDFMGNSVILSYFMPHDTDCAEKNPKYGIICVRVCV